MEGSVNPRNPQLACKICTLAFNSHTAAIPAILAVDKCWNPTLWKTLFHVHLFVWIPTESMGTPALHRHSEVCVLNNEREASSPLPHCPTHIVTVWNGEPILDSTLYRLCTEPPWIEGALCFRQSPSTYTEQQKQWWRRAELLPLLTCLNSMVSECLNRANVEANHRRLFGQISWTFF